MDTGFPHPRVLAIHPIPDGFGYAVLEGPEILVDWGIGVVKDNPGAIRRVQDLIRLYDPDVLVAEDCRDRRSRRRQRARALIEKLGRVVPDSVAVRCIPAARLRELFGEGGPTNKTRIAAAIARHFDALANRVPPPRRAWMSADRRLAIFDAAGLALAFYVSDQDGRT